MPDYLPLDPQRWRSFWAAAAPRLGTVHVVAQPGRPTEPGPFTGMTTAPFAMLCLTGSISVGTADGGGFVLRSGDGCLWAAGTWVSCWHADCPRYLRATFGPDEMLAAVKDPQLCRVGTRRADLCAVAVRGGPGPAVRGLLSGLAGQRWTPEMARAAFATTLWSAHAQLDPTAAPAADGAWPRIAALAGRDPSPTRAAAARELGLAPETISRLCRRHGGCTWLELVDAARLGRAELVLRGEKGLADIAERCGFASAQHLIRRFRLRHGTTPEAWRRRFANHISILS